MREQSFEDTNLELPADDANITPDGNPYIILIYIYISKVSVLDYNGILTTDSCLT